MTLTVFVDRNVANSAIQVMHDFGLAVEKHDDHFEQTTDDVVWLPEVAAAGWVILTKDKAIGKNLLEVEVLARANAKVFALTGQGWTRRATTTAISKAVGWIQKLSETREPPFIAKIYKRGEVKMWQDKAQLLSRLRDSDADSMGTG